MRSRYKNLFVLLVLIGIFNFVDFWATQDLVVFGGHSEWNPLMQGLVGTPYFALYKLVLIPAGLLFLWLVRKSLVPKYMNLVRFTCGIYALLMLYTWAVFYA